MGYKAVMYLAPVLRGQAVSLKVKILNFFLSLKSILKGLNHIYIFFYSKKKLSKKTIVKVRGGPRSMVKDHTFALINFGTLP